MTMARFAIFLLGSLALLGVAVGAEGRALPFDTVLIGTKGTKIEDPKEGVLTLGRVAVDALLVMSENERSLSGTDKFKRGELAHKIFSEPKAPLKIEEIALIKERIGLVYGPEVVTPAWKLIEGTTSDGK